MPRRQVIGVVTSDRAEKTRRVEIGRVVRHPKYGKYMRRRTVCHVHDEENTSKLGDTVEIVECPPRSKTKRWEFVRIVSESQLVDLVAMRASQKAESEAAGDSGASGGSGTEGAPTASGPEGGGAESGGAEDSGAGPA